MMTGVDFEKTAKFLNWSFICMLSIALHILPGRRFKEGGDVWFRYQYDRWDDRMMAYADYSLLAVLFELNAH